MISEYNGISPKRDLLLIQQLGRKLKGKSFLHVNSTKEGGGVAEILQRMIPLMKGLGIDARWEVINGDKTFYDTTKTIHNTLQGDKGTISKKAWDHYYEVNRKNAAKLDLEADAVLIHDPQPAPLIDFRKGGLWFWRCHIDVSNPNPEVCKHFSSYASKYLATVFSLHRFAKPITSAEYIMPPSIVPLSQHN